MNREDQHPGARYEKILIENGLESEKYRERKKGKQAPGENTRVLSLSVDENNESNNEEKTWPRVGEFRVVRKAQFVGIKDLLKIKDEIKPHPQGIEVWPSDPVDFHDFLITNGVVSVVRKK